MRKLIRCIHRFEKLDVVAQLVRLGDGVSRSTTLGSKPRARGWSLSLPARCTRFSPTPPPFSSRAAPRPILRCPAVADARRVPHAASPVVTANTHLRQRSDARLCTSPAV